MSGCPAASMPTVAAPLDREPPQGMPIPGRLNGALVVLVVGGAVALLWLGSRVGSGYATLGVGVVFSYVLLTNYALFHALYACFSFNWSTRQYVGHACSRRDV